MLTVISPAKALDYESPLATQTHTEPRFLEHSAELIAPGKQPAKQCPGMSRIGYAQFALPGAMSPINWKLLLQCFL